MAVNKAVILLSTMHSDTAVNVDEQKKPRMIMYYNKYKTGVDIMDQMVGDILVTDERRDGHLQCFSTYCTLANLQHI